MTTAFREFAAAARDLAPRAAVVLGSGLAGVTAGFQEAAAIPFGDVPGLAPPTIHGHGGRLVVGTWANTPALVYFGRLHFYEGHSRDTVVGTIRTVADLGVRTVILTNAAGGIHPSLVPGSLMAICGHRKLIGPGGWRELADGTPPSTPYSSRLLAAILDHESAAGRDLLAGIYAMLTGPCYETPAEIRALQTHGVDAVGMSTAFEAEAAAALDLEVAAISCVTNQAAGLSAAPLDHREVLVNAKLAVERLGRLLTHVLAQCNLPDHPK